MRPYTSKYSKKFKPAAHTVIIFEDLFPLYSIVVIDQYANYLLNVAPIVPFLLISAVSAKGRAY